MSNIITGRQQSFSSSVLEVIVLALCRSDKYLEIVMGALRGFR
jgi:hypothetical protein